jgi:arylsulfatase A-like enzyme
MQMWRIPGRAPRVVTGIARSIDIAPTVLELAGVPHGTMDGTSMLRDFDAGFFPERDRYAESFYGEGCVSMVRSDGFKFVSTGFEREEEKIGPQNHRMAVFDLRADPREYVNLVSSEKGREVVRWAREMHASLKPRPRT